MKNMPELKIGVVAGTKKASTREVIYVPSVEEMEALPDAEEMKNRGFGGLPIQIGYCNGDNRKLNGLEYHRSSEINIAVNNLVLLLGREQDIEADDTYDTSRVEAYAPFLPGFRPHDIPSEFYRTF